MQEPKKASVVPILKTFNLNQLRDAHVTIAVKQVGQPSFELLLDQHEPCHV